MKVYNASRPNIYKAVATAIFICHPPSATLLPHYLVLPPCHFCYKMCYSHEVKLSVLEGLDRIIYAENDDDIEEIWNQAISPYLWRPQGNGPNHEKSRASWFLIKILDIPIDVLDFSAVGIRKSVHFLSLFLQLTHKPLAVSGVLL